MLFQTYFIYLILLYKNKILKKIYNFLINFNYIYFIVKSNMKKKLFF